MASTDARPLPIKNTAFRFYFAIRKNDGTLITTWAGMDSEVSLDGAAFSDCTNEATEIGTTGCGYIDLTSSEMNADAVIYKLTVTNTSALPIVVTFFPEEAGDINVDVTAFGGTAGTFASGIPEVKVASIAANAITATSINADAITDAKVAADVTIASVTGAVGSVTGAVGSVTGSVGSVASGGITAASFAANAITAAKLDPDVTTELQAGLATAAALATVDGIVDDILLDTAEIGTAGAGLTNINLPNQTMDIVGNITGNLSGSVGSVTGAVGSVTGAVGSVTGLTAADVGAIKTETDKLADTLEDDAGTYRFTTNALEQAPTGGSAPTVGQIADAVWEEDLSDHSGTVGSVAEALNAAGAAGDPWSTALPGAYGSGSAGKIIGDNINATISSRATQTSVDDIPTNAELATSQASADDATLAAIAALNNLSTAQVNAEVDTALADVGLTTTITGRIDAAVSTRASQTSVDDLPTNVELATALGTADDAVLAAIAALNNLSAAQVASALNTYDAPTKAEFDAAVALLATAANLALVPAAVLSAADANPIAANVQEINDTALTGDGNSTPWGPAA